jgi:hypothetical protein
MSDVQELNINNTTYDIKAKSVVDTNSGALKFWSGTQAQYEAIVTKDSNTIYNVNDTTAPVVDILNALYPVGAIYIGTMQACPLATLGIGTWQLVAQDRVLQGAGTRGAVGTTINESLPNIKGSANFAREFEIIGATGAMSVTSYTSASYYYQWQTTNYGGKRLNVDASRSSSTYQDNAPVQQDGYLVNIWERVA